MSDDTIAIRDAVCPVCGGVQWRYAPSEFGGLRYVCAQCYPVPASRSPAPEGQEAEHVSSREAAERGGSWVSFAVHERTLAALAGARTDASALREQGEAIAQRVAYEYARIRHERSLCNPMLRCSSCPRWEELSEEARLAMAQDFDGEAVMSAVRAALDAARPGAPEGGSDGD